MIRTIISLDPEDKAWLDRMAKQQRVSMTKLVRRAIQRMRQESDSTPSRFDTLLHKTAGSENLVTHFLISAGSAENGIGDEPPAHFGDFIDHFNGVPAASQYLAANAWDAAVSVITRAEVLTGFGGTTVPEAAAFLDCFPILSIDRTTADLAAVLRRTYRWKLPDAFQAAIAQQHGLMLVTRNRRDFPPDRHRFVHIPYRA